MLQLIIGSKNYSSWSLRPWLLMTEAGIPFTEVVIPLRTPTVAADIARYSPAGRVPVLIDDEAQPDGWSIWDSLAIAEYIAERFPDRDLWPSDPTARGLARSITAEMHAGFATLREAMPFNVEARLPGRGWSVSVQRDIDRIAAIWSACLARSGGPLLFGGFTIADAFYAPAVSRFATYAVELPAATASYRDRILALSGMQAWTAAALAEGRFIPEAEPYRLRA